MFLIERVSAKVGHSMASYLNMDKDHEEILTYGAITFFQTFFSLLLIIIFGFTFHVLLESLVLAFTVGLLRKYSGGVHSASPNRCAIIGAVISVGLVKVIEFLTRAMSFTSMSLLIAASLIYSFSCICKYAPVDSSEKPINNILKRKRLKRYSIITLGIMFIIISFLIIFYKISASKLFLIYADCIVAGTVWQTFTLTYLGYNFLHKIDSYFIKLSKEE